MVSALRENFVETHFATDHFHRVAGADLNFGVVSSSLTWNGDFDRHVEFDLETAAFVHVELLQGRCLVGQQVALNEGLDLFFGSIFVLFVSFRLLISSRSALLGVSCKIVDFRGEGACKAKLLEDCLFDDFQASLLLDQD